MAAPRRLVWFSFGCSRVQGGSDRTGYRCGGDNRSFTRISADPHGFFAFGYLDLRDPGFLEQLDQLFHLSYIHCFFLLARGRFCGMLLGRFEITFSSDQGQLVARDAESRNGPDRNIGEEGLLPEVFPSRDVRQMNLDERDTDSEQRVS
jgi:hypothetical protein